MHIRAHRSAGLEELTRRRNQIAHELVNAPEGERATQRYLAKELEMNAYTERIEQLRRQHAQQAPSLCQQDSNAILGGNPIAGRPGL